MHVALMNGFMAASELLQVICQEQQQQKQQQHPLPQANRFSASIGLRDGHGSSRTYLSRLLRL
jgi:hypothetical protein